MNFITPLAPAYPEIFLLGMVCVILVADLFVSDDNRVATYALTQIALAGCFAVTLFTAREIEPVTTFSGMFVDDLMSDVLKLLVYLGVMVMLVYSRAYIASRGLFRGEFFVLTLFATLGMMVMISANHLLTLYLGLELMSLALYAMVALQRDSPVATEAAMKYFVLGALASGMMLYGMSMLYGATGTLGIGPLASASSLARCPSTCGSRTSTTARPLQSRCSSARRPSWRPSRSSCGCWRRGSAQSRWSRRGSRCWS
jgi:NADH-quinone oxidoreductase subunit N